MKNHLHLDKKLWTKTNNVIYIVTRELSIDGKKMGYPGAGTIKFSEDLILTELNKNINPKLNKSIWTHVSFPQGCLIIQHGNRINNSKWR